ncbi:hypothetical protein DL764_003906 [Monosporascus ibericus]|uniref:tRNA (adenine(58)-N(1))-methyltransferase catalytic subunit TRM61 n=1 Tax=Monosporascus ibericus TaxID=155417 RepID=A0A4Q4TFE5_9PEZI|nr:hypothetical protein DL764_003906 [Monosporascus ibericus]
MPNISPFLDPGTLTTPSSLAIVHLSRDNLQPVYLRDYSGVVDGYAEGAVINTRFGSFPHSTLLNIPWGSQVRASIVDTGSRGRKRKIAQVGDGDGQDKDSENTASDGKPARNAVTASSGFVHILPPTPEIWTTSLPHRTQVVYTPDYSYILHRIRARPGMRIIEAGAGSGSFTHAAVRAVYNGYPDTPDEKTGKIFSFEFDKSRYEKMQEEIHSHGLDGLVQLTHRDVYNEGFLLDGESPQAECIFLDLPAPWRALPHLSRRRPKPNQLPADAKALNGTDSDWKSPLRADRSVYICTFSPCIEQVTQTIEVMRRLGWMEIEMVEVCHKKINVARERVGLNMPNDRGTNLTPGSVDEAVTKLREVEIRFREFHAKTQDADATMEDDTAEKEAAEDVNMNGDGNQQDGAAEDTQTTKPWMLGRLTHRTEAELKTHTSYLVFAVLPQEWSEEQEAAAFEKWPCGKESKVIGNLDKEARKQEKREFLKGKKRKKEADRKAEEDAAASDPKKSKTTS